MYYLYIIHDKQNRHVALWGKVPRFDKRQRQALRGMHRDEILELLVDQLTEPWQKMRQNKEAWRTMKDIYSKCIHKYQ